MFYIKKDNAPVDLLLYFYMQEKEDFSTVLFKLKRLRKAIEEADIGALGKSDFREPIFNISICRLIENFISGQGDESKRNFFLKDCIMQYSVLCGGCLDAAQPSNISIFSNLPTALIRNRHQLQSMNEENLSDAMKVFPNLAYFKILYHPEILTDKKVWDNFLGLPDLIEQCNELLEHYVAWWLKGIGLSILSGEEVTESLKGTGIVFDPLCKISKDERTIFDIAFRSVYFSLLCLSTVSPLPNSIREIALKGPKELPGFEALDLWLQRKAAGIVFDSEGLNLFFDHIADLRLMLLGYLVAKQDIGAEDRNRLYRWVHAHSEADSDHLNIFFDIFNSRYGSELEKRKIFEEYDAINGGDDW